MKDDLQNFLDELRERVPISEIVGEKVKLTKRGREYIGLCPFHHEKTPSFTINDSKGFYHCFGCGAHGDVVRFVTESTGLSFIEAVKKLAARVGMQLPELTKESQERILKRKSLYEIMDIAASFFEKNLYMPIGANGLGYLRNKRQLSDVIIKKFRLGYAPNNNGLKALLGSKGIAEQDMVDLGLISIPEDKSRPSHDFFRDRVIIPIMDKQGHVIAFGGRILGDGQPKYLNSPETPIFNKRRVLYNLNNARDASYNSKRLIICEGYMDVIALDSFDFNYAVAPLGTSLTEEQIIEAWKVCNTPILCFDGDNAGIRAAIRSIDRVLPILKAGYSVKYIFLKEKKDPDELLHTLGAEIFEKYIERAKPLVDILWHKCKMNKAMQTPEEKASIEKEIYEEIAKIKDTQVRNYYLQEMKERIYYAFGKGAVYKKNKGNASLAASGKHLSSYETSGNFAKGAAVSDIEERNIVCVLLLYPQLLSKYEKEVSNLEFSNSELNKILLDIIEIYQDEEITDSDILIEKIRLNHKTDNFWELQMYKQQNPPLADMKRLLDDSLAVIQLKQIDKDIKNCLALMEAKSANSDDIFDQYQRLVKEKEKILEKQKK